MRRGSYNVREIFAPCDGDECSRRATHYVETRHGDVFGRYCITCALAKVDALERYEQAVDYANGKGSR